LFGGALTYHCYIRWIKPALPFWYRRSGIGILYLLLLVWPVSFITIYLYPTTRVQASTWIYQHIPPQAVLATEHWDDPLPIGGTIAYRIETLPLYDADTPEKWQQINASLKRSDYILLASNRLYTPLMKLTDCPKLPPGRCYPKTAAYYQKLFNGQLGFIKVAEFTQYPTIPFFDLPIDDQAADESFTVYDHPKIMIFKKL
jgi:hypothetical protein